MKGLFVTLFVVLGMAAAVVVQGVCLRILWAWFVVPLGAPAIGAATAVGLSIVANLLTHSGERQQTEDETWWSAFVGIFVRPLGALALGWFVRFFV